MKLLLLCAVLVTVSYRGGWAQCNFFGKIPASDDTCCSTNNTDCCRFSTGGPCFCNIYSANQSCFGFYNVTAPDVSQCCGTLQLKKFYTQVGNILIKESYEYLPTNNEKAGLCRRNPSIAWNTPQSYEPNPLPGPCSCQKKVTACFAPTTTTQTTTTTTTPTVTTTTTRTTATATTTTPTATTTTTTATTTTTKPPPVCPVPPAAAFARVLGGTPVKDSCTVDGIVDFFVGSTQACNGVLAYDPNTKSNRLLITDFCLQTMKGYLPTQSVAYGLYNGATIQITQQTASAPIGNFISAIKLPTGILPKATCKTAACVYDKTTMSSIIDFKSCYFASYGYDQKLGNAVINTGALKIVNVTKQTTSTCTTPILNPAGQCFVAKDGTVRGCWGDAGAPVFCRLTITNEPVLYGMLDSVGQPPKQLTGATSSSGECSSTTEFSVVPVS
ncbi:uncharacterized protein LOC143291877 [Babylonia areolata]|uniref:uncharacterized protein LOC143291877 n=1 Tax=Babylonia areolata TaxID=304850 RepID=UPI003FD1D789